jgi:hypothetical protein
MVHYLKGKQFNFINVSSFNYTYFYFYTRFSKLSTARWGKQRPATALPGNEDNTIVEGYALDASIHDTMHMPNMLP